MPADHSITPGRRWGGASFRLGMGVVAWWLLVAAAVALLSPTPAVAVLKVAVGLPAYVHLPGLVPAYPSFPIPVERAAFDLAQRGYRESDEQMLNDAASLYVWVTVTHGQRVTVIETDGTVAQVELLDGPYAGRRGWLKHGQLVP
jgi:hypothetical protein